MGHPSVVGCLEENRQLQKQTRGGAGGIAFPHLRIEIWGTRCVGLVEENRQLQKQIRGFFAPFRMTKNVGWAEENRQQQKQVLRLRRRMTISVRVGNDAEGEET